MEEAADTGIGELPNHHAAVEAAVLDLLDEREGERAPGVERIAA
jgi:hypothetical protein